MILNPKTVFLFIQIKINMWKALKFETYINFNIDIVETFSHTHIRESLLFFIQDFLKSLYSIRNNNLPVRAENKF